jgi:glycosidase
MVAGVTAWVDHAIWWHVYPLGFTGAEKAAGAADAPVRHRLGRLSAWLDYAIGLGCSGLLLGPVFAASTHGYDTIDHFRIDPRLGDEADFAELVEAARSRGLRIVLDGVFNHVGRSFPMFRSALAGDPAALRWFRGDPVGGFGTFEGHEQLIALDHSEQVVADYVASVMTYWLDRGASGWRLDAAYAVPAAFWRTVLPKVRATHPDAWFLGEMIHGDYAAYARDARLDSITQYELWKAIWSSLNDRNFFELAWALERHNGFLSGFPDGGVPQTFVGNHDVTRLASVLSDGRHFGHALAVLFTVGGIPSIYYGDEQGFAGIKEDRAGGDDAIRPAFPARSDELDGFDRLAAFAGAEGFAGAGGPEVYRLHQRLIGFRRRNPWLVRARTTAEHLSNTAFAYRCAEDGGGAGIVVLLNTGDETVRFPVDVSGLAVAVAPEAAGSPSGMGEPAVVPGHSWVVLG